MSQQTGKKTLIVFLLLALAAGCWLINGFADAPELSDLQVISSTSLGDVWLVQLTLDVAHQPLAAVSNLKLRAYDYEEYKKHGSQGAVLVAESIDHPVQANNGNFVNDYPVSIEIPKSASGHLVIEACAKHGNEQGCTTWEGWIPQESSYEFSGGLDFSLGTQPADSGEFLSNQGILSVMDASAGMTVSLDTKDCRLQHADLDAEIPTWWRVWDSHADADGKLEPGELIDTGWIPVAEFIKMNGAIITIPAGWSGNILFQLKMKRSDYGNRAGHYSCALGVEVNDGS